MGKPTKTEAKLAGAALQARRKVRRGGRPVVKEHDPSLTPTQCRCHDCMLTFPSYQKRLKNPTDV